MITTEQSVSAKVASLPALPIKGLWILWDQYFPRRPARPNRSYLESHVAYKIQEAAYGGLSMATRMLPGTSRARIGRDRHFLGYVNRRKLLYERYIERGGCQTA